MVKYELVPHFIEEGFPESGKVLRLWRFLMMFDVFFEGLLGLGWLKDVWGILGILRISMEFYGYLGLCGKAPSLTSSFLAFPSQDLPGANVFSIFFHFIEASPCKTVLLPIL